MVVVIAGDILNGFEFYGPFTDGTTAVQWAEEYVSIPWQIARLEHPADVLVGG